MKKVLQHYPKAQEEPQVHSSSRNKVPKEEDDVLDSKEGAQQERVSPRRRTEGNTTSRCPRRGETGLQTSLSSIWSHHSGVSPALVQVLVADIE